jgi:hypothetical protein
MKYLLFFFSLVFVNLVFADIYKVIDKHGNIIYTDAPESDAEKIEVTSAPLHITAPTTPSVETNTAPIASPVTLRKPYKVFAISSPTNEETIHNNPNITINLTIEPALKASDKIQILVDEKPIGNPVNGIKIDIGRLDRGVHQVKAVVLDETQTILNVSPLVTIFVHYGIANSNS